MEKIKGEPAGATFEDEAMIGYGPIADEDIYKDQSEPDIGSGFNNDAYLVSSSFN